MHSVLLKARAKINLTLDVVGRREDGYHDVRMIMQTINLYDTLYIRKSNQNKIALRTNLKWLPTDERNLVYRAAQMLKENMNLKQGIYMELNKVIPVAAGLAGGSSDAAAALVGINRLLGLQLSRDTLMEIGKQLGADVPYCILRGTALAEGIGEKLTPLPPLPNCYIVLAKPNVRVSTAEIYKNLDIKKISSRPDTEAMIESIRADKIEHVAEGLCNVLETVTIPRYPIIQELKEFFIRKGALGAVMSGSGPTVYGIFETKKRAREAAYQLKYKNMARTVFCTSLFNSWVR